MSFQLGALTSKEIKQAMQRITAWLALFAREHLGIIWETLYQLVGDTTFSDRSCLYRFNRAARLTMPFVYLGIFDEKPLKPEKEVPRPSLRDDGTPTSSVEEPDNEDSFDFCESDPP